MSSVECLATPNKILNSNKYLALQKEADIQTHMINLRYELNTSLIAIAFNSHMDSISIGP